MKSVKASYRCPDCSQAFVVAGEVCDDELVCVCGSALSPHELDDGIYAVGAPVSDDDRSTSPPRQPTEADLGYGASHGNDPTHSGPTGPGDAPAA